MLNRVLFYFFFISFFSTSVLMAGKSDEEDESFSNNFSDTHINDDSYKKKRKKNPNIDNQDIEINPFKKIKTDHSEYELLEKIKDFCINFKDSTNIQLKKQLLFNIIKQNGFLAFAQNNIKIKEYENYIETILLQLKNTFPDKECVKYFIRI